MSNFQKGGLFLIFLHLFTCGKTQTEILISPEVNQQQYPHKKKGCCQIIKTDDQTASSLKEFKNNMIEMKKTLQALILFDYFIHSRSKFRKCAVSVSF